MPNESVSVIQSRTRPLQSNRIESQSETRRDTMSNVRHKDIEWLEQAATAAMVRAASCPNPKRQTRNENESVNK